MYFQLQEILHILSKNSIVKELNKNCEFLFVDNIDEFYKEINNKTYLYDLVIITDLLEQVDNMNIFFNTIDSKLSNNGKILLTSINNIWYPLLEFFEFLQLKNKSEKAYTSIKKNQKYSF